MIKRALSIVLLFIAGSGCLAIGYQIVSLFLFPQPGAAAGAVIRVAIMAAFVAGFVFGAAKLWNRWLIAFGVILVLMGIGSLQTKPSAEDEAANARIARAFEVTGGVLAGAGALAFLIASRRRFF